MIMLINSLTRCPFSRDKRANCIRNIFLLDSIIRQFTFFELAFVFNFYFFFKTKRANNALLIIQRETHLRLECVNYLNRNQGTFYKE